MEAVVKLDAKTLAELKAKALPRLTLRGLFTVDEEKTKGSEAEMAAAEVYCASFCLTITTAASVGDAWAVSSGASRGG